MSTGDKEFNKRFAASETARILAEKFGIQAIIVGDVVRVEVPDTADAEDVLDAVSSVAADVNKKFGTAAFVHRRTVPRDHPGEIAPVTAVVTPKSDVKPSYGGLPLRAATETVKLVNGSLEYTVVREYRDPAH